MVAVAMTTAHTRPSPTVLASLASLRAAGYTGKVQVSVDGPQAPDVSSDPNWEVVTHGTQLLPLKHWARTLEAAVYTSSCPWVLVLQDDTVWAAGGWSALWREVEALGPKATGAGLLSLFLVDKIAREISRARHLSQGWHESSLGYQSGGALGYLMPRASAERLLSDDGFKALVATRERNIDRLVPGRLNELGLTCLFRYPSLLNHRLGSGNSSIKPKKPHDTSHWRATA